MSKVAALMRATKLNEQKSIPSQLIRFEISCTPEIRYTGRMQGFKIVSEFGAKCFVDLDQNNALQDRIGAMRRAVIHEVFGEFIQPVHALYSSLYERDFDTAIEQLKALERQMFSEET